MGNTLCRHQKTATPATTSTADNNRFKFHVDRLLERVHLCPSSISNRDSSVNNAKRNRQTINRYEINPVRIGNAENNSDSKIIENQEKQIISVSGGNAVLAYDWTDATLQAPIYQNIADFINEESVKRTPIPPPRKFRKHRKSEEDIESRAIEYLNEKLSKSKVENDLKVEQVPVEEPACVQTIVHKHICIHDEEPHILYKKHNKHHSTVSLPNISDLKFSLADIDDQINSNNKNNDSLDYVINRTNNRSKTPPPSSSVSLTETSSVPANTNANENNRKVVTKLENYMTRCRSFGSLLPSQLLEKLRVVNNDSVQNKLNSNKQHGAQEAAESDDSSWGGLDDDWNVGIIEHYKPHDNSLPRPSSTSQFNKKMLKNEANEKKLFSSLEASASQLASLPLAPVPPARKNERNTTKEDLTQTPPPTPELERKHDENDMETISFEKKS